MGTKRSSWVRKMVAAAVVVAAASAGAAGAGALGDPNGQEGPEQAPYPDSSSPSEAVFVPVNPCRIVNTQNGAGKIGVQQVRQYRMHGNTSGQGGAAACGVPQHAAALEISVTSVAANGAGYLRVYPAGIAAPQATFLNYGGDHNITSAGTVRVQPGSGVNFQVQALVQPTHVIVDVLGYYVYGIQASVNLSGTVARGNGVTSSMRESTGLYRVNFDRDLRGCAYTATIGNAGQGTASQGEIVTAPSNLDIKGVYVYIRDNAGNPINRPFHLIVSC